MKSKVMGKLATFVLVATVALSACMFVGCGGSQKNDNEILIWGGDQWAGNLERKVQNFVKYFNDTKSEELGFTIKFAVKTNLTTSVKTDLRNNKAADIVLWDRFFTPSNTTVLLPLDEMIENSDADLSVFNSESLREMNVGGSQYGLPVDLDAWGIFVNMDILNEYNNGKSGDAVAKLPATWSELLDTAEKLTVKSGNKVTRAGLNITSLDGSFYAFAQTAGSSIINLETGMSNVTTPEALDVITLFESMYKKPVGEDGLGDEVSFINKKLAMTFGSMFFPATIEKYTADELNLKFLPYPARDMHLDNGKLVKDDSVTGITTGTLGGYGLSILQPDAKFRDVKWEARVQKAWKVIETWLYSDDLCMKFHTETETLSARNDLHGEEYFVNHPYIGSILEYIDDYKIRPNVAGYEAFEAQAVRAQIQTLFEGNQNAATTLVNIQTEGDRILKAAQGK